MGYDSCTAAYDIAQAITSTLEESEILGQIVTIVSRALNAEAGRLWHFDRKTGKLELVAALQKEFPPNQRRFAPGQSLAGWVTQHGEPLLVPDVVADPRFDGDIGPITRTQTRSIMCVPLRARDHLIGVLEVVNKLGESPDLVFSAGDMDSLTTLAAWVSVAMETARLSHTAQESAATQAHQQVAVALAHNINNRLMAFELDLDDLENSGTLQDPRAVRKLFNLARRCIREVSAVVKALDHLGDLDTITYVGDTQMVDFSAAIEEQLRQLER